MACYLKISVLRVDCRDPETLSSSGDLFSMSGAVVVDNAAQGFILPWRWLKSGGYATFGDTVFEGIADGPRFGLAFVAYDLDHNRKWEDNKDAITTSGQVLGQALGMLPFGGPMGVVLSKAPAAIVGAINWFVGNDDDDELTNYQEIIELPAPASSLKYHMFDVRFKGDDPTGYSDWDYTVSFSVQYYLIAPGFPGSPVSSELQPAQRTASKQWMSSTDMSWRGGQGDVDVTARIGRSAGLFGRGRLDVTVTEYVKGAETQTLSQEVPISRVFLESGQRRLEADEPLWKVVLENSSPGGNQTRRSLHDAAKIPGPTIGELLRQQIGSDILVLQNRAVLEMYYRVAQDAGSISTELRYLRPVDNVLYREAGALIKAPLTLSLT